MTDLTDAAVGSGLQGSVASGFEPVRDLFVASLPDLGEGGAAYAVYHRGEPVVDLWAGDAGGRPWAEDTPALFMSTTKAVTAFCYQLLHERGVVDAFAKVADYWPEFAANGKQDVTLAQVLSHSSGVLGSPEVTALIDLEDGSGVDRTSEISAAVAAAAPMWPPGSQAGYQTMSFGWILEEIIRRADGRDLGTFFREEVAGPLGCDDLYIGTPADRQGSIATVLPMMWPAMPDEMREFMEAFLAAARDETTPAGVSCVARGGVGVLDRLPEVFNTTAGRAVPMGGSNMCGTARSAARVFAAIADPERGVGGVRLSSAEALATFSAVREERPDVVTGIPLSRGLGYNRNVSLIPGRPPAFGPNAAAVGHSGIGGQVGFADPVAKVGSAFVRSHYTTFPALPLLLTNTLYQCLPS